MLKKINAMTSRVGFMLVPVPPSTKMLNEHANVSEAHHPSLGGRTVEWMRTVANLI